jgi:D-beta-D-heptose 7-phosphate kinase/D-beta-D-heptose 1-phosphate adenosyltransferase
LATGVFDLLHREHRNFLSKARQAGDCLLVGIETDQRVKNLKGHDRPIQDQSTRVKNVANLDIADGVFLLPEKFYKYQDHLQLIKLIRPNILAVSQNSPNLVQKQKIMKQIGGEVRVVYQHNPRVSTTQIINKSEKFN